MTMTDRELIELAAKAVGYDSIMYHEPKRGNGPLSAAWAGPWMEVRKPEAPLGNCRWNPLTDDGDALRLAVKLELFDLWWFTEEDLPMAMREVDTYAATRRAIVRAAAEIGRSQ